MKKYLKYIGLYLIILIFITILMSFLNLIGLNSTITNLIMFIFNTLTFLIFGFKNGKKAKNKGFLEGLKIGLIFISILILITIASLNFKFSLSTFIYYIILILSSTMGGMIGINKSKTTC